MRTRAGLNTVHSYFVNVCFQDPVFSSQFKLFSYLMEQFLERIVWGDFFISILLPMEDSEPVMPDGIFLTKNSNLGKFWKVLQWKMLRPLFDGHFVYIFYGQMV
jgi:hypothetical protein